jgi:TonB family protein
MQLATAHLIPLAILFVQPFASAQAFEGDCSPRIVQDETTFPMRSQLRGQEGTVFMDVLIDEQGRPANVHLVESSGYLLLDSAAQRSVISHWQFDISACERKDLPIRRRIAVEYRNDEYR